ncbi:MAG: 50S ribosomal protein L22 [Candidatus Sungbacteria bacterium]|nr:50S ribosomal protein L22 [Candidatus Sungbacteria bacterium]
MEIIAKSKYIHISPRKVRLVANLIKGMEVAHAETELAHHPKHASLPIAKLLHSAIANAKHNFSIEEQGLYIQDIAVGAGPVLKRTRARAFGRAAMIRKRMSHISIVLAENKAAGNVKFKNQNEK